jgi:hypothetical protein
LLNKANLFFWGGGGGGGGHESSLISLAQIYRYSYLCTIIYKIFKRGGMTMVNTPHPPQSLAIVLKSTLAFKIITYLKFFFLENLSQKFKLIRNSNFNNLINILMFPFTCGPKVSLNKGDPTCEILIEIKCK